MTSSAGANATIRLQLVGARAAAAGLASTQAGVQQLNKVTGNYNTTVREGTHRTWLMNQALFTMRRFAYAGTLALTALASGAVFLGIKFQMSMEQNRIAMTHFLGSEGAARRELDLLYQVAAKTPFEFQQVTDAARRFMAFGFSLKETNQALQVIGDTAAGLGGNPAENIERLVLVLGQVRATGRVLGQDMLQLQQLGINTNQIFRDELGLTREQLKNGIGELQIPSEVAIPALLRGMQKQFDGMAAAQAKTLTGMLSTLHDYTAQLFGSLTMPIFARLHDTIVPGLISLTQEMQQASNSGATFADQIAIIDRHLGAHGGLSMLFATLANTAEAFGAIIMNVVVPGMRPFLPLLFLVLAVAEQLSGVFLFLADHSQILAFYVSYLTAVFVAHRIAAFAAFIMDLRLALAWGIGFFWAGKYGRGLIFLNTILKTSVVWMRAAWIWATRRIGAYIIETLATAINTTAIWLNTRAQVGNNLVRAFAIVLMWRSVTAWIAATAAQWALNISMLAFPGTWILLAIAGLGIGLFLLDRRFHLVAEAVRDFIDAFKDAVAFIEGKKNIWDIVTGGTFKGGLLNHAVTHLGVPESWVGLGDDDEQTTTPRRRRPNNALAAAGLPALGQGLSLPEMGNIIQIYSTLEMDGKAVGKGVTRHKLDRQAR